MKNKSYEFNESELYIPFYSETEDISVLTSVNNFTIILGIIFGLGMILNSISIVSIIKTKRKEPISLMILNLAVADIVYIAGILN
jgi:hypothetical protein